MLLLGSTILCFELGCEIWSSVLWVAESVGAQHETLLVRARFLRTRLSLQREADEQSLVLTPPFSVNSVPQDLNCAVGLVWLIKVVQGIKSHIFHEASGRSQKAPMRWCSEDEMWC